MKKRVTFPIEGGYTTWSVEWEPFIDTVVVRNSSDAIMARIPVSALAQLNVLAKPRHEEPLLNTGPDDSTHLWSPGRGEWVRISDKPVEKR